MFAPGNLWCLDFGVKKKKMFVGEEVIRERFSGWFKWGMSIHEFWDIFFTDRRVIFAFLGETFTSFLLRGDVSASRRQAIEGFSPEAILNSHPQNYQLFYSELEKVVIKKGTFLMMPRLTISAKGNRQGIFFKKDRRHDVMVHLPELEKLLPGRVRAR